MPLVDGARSKYFLYRRIVYIVISNMKQETPKEIPTTKGVIKLVRTI